MFYKALVVDEINGKFTATVKNLPLKKLDNKDLLIKVNYSALNYKDALSAHGNKGVTKSYPHTPGIDAVGTIARSNSKNFKEGDEVIVTGYDLGMNTPGAFSEYISVPEEWVLPLPKNLTQKEAISIGTSGFTAAIGIEKLLRNSPLQKNDTILVTGATGAVGSFAIKLLSSLDFNITAVSKKREKNNFLLSLGAKKVIAYDEFNKNKTGILLKPIYDGALDTIGGKTLENILKQIKAEGSIAICGMIDSFELNTTVFPFILRGINLLGIDSASYPKHLRKELWNKLSNEWKIDISSFSDEKSLEEIPRLLENMINGKSLGRIIIKIKH